MFDRVWEDIHTKREWGRYPKEELVRWVARNYYQAEDRSAVRFLDLGCGAGASSWFLAREGFSVVAFDGAESAVRRVQTKAKLVADAVHLPFKDDSFDAVVDIVSVAHNPIDDAKRIIGEMVRVLRPGGRVFSAIPAREGNHEAYEGKGAVLFLDLYEVTELYSRYFKEVRVDCTLTSEDGKYTKLWFVKARLTEK